MLTYLNESTTWPSIQLVACLLILWDLLTFRRGASRHRPAMAWLAYALCVACAMTVVKLLCGVRPPPGPLEAMLTVALCLAIGTHRGDLAHLLRTARAVMLRLWWRVRR
ncbi:phage holin family protein [Dyella sp. ASV21]|uniref:phage holin family protein n=1 Tax=Dyella sp. ASV21 TaxID=2795114 RepID=UPI0018EC3904|nr:phage holin family protein [Dyella sp. ASV21]